MLRHTLLVLHLLSVFAWVGGMFFAHFCLRPAAMETLQPPQRLPLWSATLRRFFRFVAVAVLLILVTGFLLFLPVGFKAAPVGWHVMLALGVVMAGVFVYIYVGLYPKLVKNCRSSAWADAAQVQNRIRQLVSLNLALGVVVILAAVSAR
jgi:uncharacterized membrane protein